MAMMAAVATACHPIPITCLTARSFAGTVFVGSNNYNIIRRMRIPALCAISIPSFD
jgi:hypothetical protein